MTHLSLPLQRIASNHVRLNLSLALLHRTPVPAPGLAPFLDVLDPALVKTTTSWNLPSPLALYTFLLPQSFTAVDRSNETLQYGIIFSVSAEVVWRHGLSTSANTFHHIVGPTFGLYEELPPVVAVNGAWRATAIRPAVWLRRWAEPFWDCLHPSHSPAASCIPRPARRMLEAAGMNEDSLSLDRLVGLNSAVDRQLTGSVQYCSATPAPHSPAASASRHPAASPSSSRQPGSIAVCSCKRASFASPVKVYAALGWAYSSHFTAAFGCLLRVCTACVAFAGDGAHSL
ncbi:MAG: hypothetical protein EOO41_02615 [Methanobacteriota archaeon]|nr:MAG: hypothetical protein EOO41_02615 [Euryarchaeota archaeon]